MLKPLDTFLQSCPIHQLWKHSDTINKYILQKKGGIQIYSRFITLCSFFNCDQICLTNIPTVRSVLNKYMQSWRGDLIQSLRSTVSELLTSNKPIISIVNQNRFSQLFDPDPYVKYHLEHIEATDSTKEVFSDAELREPIWQLKEFMDNIPNSITLIGVQDPINFSEYFAHHLTTNLGSLLFKNSVADAPMVDAAFSAATQLLWPLYVLLNVSYPLRMIEFRFENTTTESHSFLELISKLRNAKENELTNDPSITFLKVFENRLIQFIKEDYKKSLYPPYGHCFFNYLQNDYKVDDFISEQGFKYFISSLGIHSSFSLDYILIVEITNIMLNIFNIYQSLSNDISTWYSDFRNNGQLWTKSSQNAQIHTAADLIVKLGIVLMIRKLLRKSMNEMIEQNIPGLIKLLNSSVLRLTSDRIGLKEDIIIEIALNKNDFKVIEIILNEKQITKCSDPIQFFFFLSLLNMNNHWNDAKFSPGNEMISYNLHLIPAAINAFIHLLKMFCSSNDSKIIGTAMQFYFSVYRRIITFKMNTVQEMSHESVNAMIILTDLFPKYINDLEYGRIGSNFPYSVITEAYREVEIKTREIEMQREKNLKMEKGKKKR
ncbi:hypothetical protein GPJ56_009450 [Histomonas meleagridis]|uniref:uncharacterized protein n=1 Tax=Histomonas meleagridis TaxID=135588 RepID=UPI00355A9363|nr:hypothetical protein GPJ56_009450 [Histomonas meleagridis]KAH0800339.1 hypothetical protein GO595_006928 [Histomonas meleagridis]